MTQEAWYDALGTHIQGVPIKRLMITAIQRIVSTLTVVVGAACTTAEGERNAQLALIGTQADGFFIRSGPPIASHELSDGRKLYLWSSGRGSVFVPGSIALQPDGLGGFYGTVRPGSEIAIECVMQLLVDRKGTIAEVRAYSDTVGWWTLSRCAEYFQQANAA